MIVTYTRSGKSVQLQIDDRHTLGVLEAARQHFHPGVAVVNVKPELVKPERKRRTKR